MSRKINLGGVLERLGSSLTELMERTPPGQIGEANGLDRLLAGAWDSLCGANEGGMEGYKLLGRMESVHWSPPLLSFVIERHGGTVCGSTRAELQHWEVDLDRMTATITKSGRRQLEPMAPRVSVREMAQEIARLILGGQKDDRLEWRTDGSVRVNTSRIFPSGTAYKMTVEGRRRRLCRYVADAVSDQGWTSVGWNRFRLTAAANGST